MGAIAVPTPTPSISVASRRPPAASPAAIRMAPGRRSAEGPPLKSIRIRRGGRATTLSFDPHEDCRRRLDAEAGCPNGRAFRPRNPAFPAFLRRLILLIAATIARDVCPHPQGFHDFPGARQV